MNTHRSHRSHKVLLFLQYTSDANSVFNTEQMEKYLTTFLGITKRKYKYAKPSCMMHLTFDSIVISEVNFRVIMLF